VTREPEIATGLGRSADRLAAEHDMHAPAKARRAQGATSGNSRCDAAVVRQVPLAAAGPGWHLTQTLADEDQGAWQVTAPDGKCAGYVSHSYRGATSWAAYPGDPADSRYRIRVILPAEGDPVAADGEWPTPEDAGLAVAIAHDDMRSGPPGQPAVGRGLPGSASRGLTSPGREN